MTASCLPGQATLLSRIKQRAAWLGLVLAPVLASALLIPPFYLLKDEPDPALGFLTDPHDARLADWMANWWKERHGGGLRAAAVALSKIYPQAAAKAQAR